jgi:hypothetical protein
MDEKDHKRILRHVKKVKAVSFSDFLVKASLKAIEQYKKRIKLDNGGHDGK